LVALVAPRVVSVVLWFFTDWFVLAFSNRFLLFVLGVVFLPFTTLAYAWAVNQEGGVHSTFFIVVMCIAVLGDLGALAGSRRRRV
jgi:hypothetical protein